MCPRTLVDRKQKRLVNAVDVVERVRDPTDQVPNALKEICPGGNNKVVIYISLYHDKCLLFMLELY